MLRVENFGSRIVLIHGCAIASRIIYCFHECTCAFASRIASIFIFNVWFGFGKKKLSHWFKFICSVICILAVVLSSPPRIFAMSEVEVRDSLGRLPSERLHHRVRLLGALTFQIAEINRWCQSTDAKTVDFEDIDRDLKVIITCSESLAKRTCKTRVFEKYFKRQVEADASRARVSAAPSSAQPAVTAEPSAVSEDVPQETQLDTDPPSFPRPSKKLKSAIYVPNLWEYKYK